MRLKDIFWPWGWVKRLERALDTAIAGLERQSETIVLGITNQLTNIEYGARQRDIAANLRSECIRLHGEVERLRELMEGVERHALSISHISSETLRGCLRSGGRNWPNYGDKVGHLDGGLFQYWRPTR